MDILLRLSDLYASGTQDAYLGTTLVSNSIGFLISNNQD